MLVPGSNPGIVIPGLGNLRSMEVYRWENHGKTMGKPWENHAKTMEHMGKSPMNDDKWR